MKWNAAVGSIAVVTTLIAATSPPVRGQSGAQNASARSLFIEGRDFWDEGKFDDAEKKFREALTKYPKADQSDRTTYYLITTLIKLGRTADARAEIDNFTRNYPQSTWRSDVEEKRLTLNGLPPVAVSVPGNYSVGFNPRGTLRVVASEVHSPFAGTILTSDPVGAEGIPVRWFANAGLEQEVLRLLIEKDAQRGLEAARERLKVNPSDPAVISNLSTIASSGSPQALSFLLTLAGNTASSPNTKSQALFWMSRSGDKDAVVKALMDMMKEKDAIPAVADTLSRFSVAERRNALDQLSRGQGPERMAVLEKIFKGSTNAGLRSQIVQSAVTINDPAALAFLSDVARNEKETTVRNAAIQGLASRKDVDAKTLEDILKALPPKPPAK